jgi:hypothetical protein
MGLNRGLGALAGTFSHISGETVEVRILWGFLVFPRPAILAISAACTDRTNRTGPIMSVVGGSGNDPHAAKAQNGHRPSPLGAMLPIVERSQSMDGTLIVVPLTGLRGLQNFSSNDLAVHFQLANILKCLASKIVCLVHSDHVSWIKGQIPERRIFVGRDLSSWKTRCKRWVAAKSPAMIRATFLTIAGQHLIRLSEASL